jgi:hypothetical protein
MHCSALDTFPTGQAAIDRLGALRDAGATVVAVGLPPVAALADHLDLVGHFGETIAAFRASNGRC